MEWKIDGKENWWNGKLVELKSGGMEKWWNRKLVE